MRPGFKSRTGNVFFVLMSVPVMCTRSGAVPNWFVAGVPGLCASRAPLAERVNQILQTKQFSGRVDTPVEVQKILGGVYSLKSRKKFLKLL